MVRSGFIRASRTLSLPYLRSFSADAKPSPVGSELLRRSAGMSVKGEPANDQHVVSDALQGFLGCFFDLLRPNGAVLGSQRYRYTPGLPVSIQELDEIVVAVTVGRLQSRCLPEPPGAAPRCWVTSVMMDPRSRTARTGSSVVLP